MSWKYVRAGLLAALLYPAWSSVHAIDVPLPRIELVPWTAVQPDPVPAPPRLQSDEAVREKDVPHRAPFLYDVMPEEEDRDDTLGTPQTPGNGNQRVDFLEIRGA